MPKVSKAHSDPFEALGVTKPPEVVIADWLGLCRAGQWTPMEAAREIVKALDEAGLQIVAKKT